MSVVAAAALALGLTVALAGCENFALGPMSIKRSGAHVAFAVCTDIDVTSVYGEYSSTAQSKDFVAFIDERGDSSLRTGATWNSGAGLPGLTSENLSDPPVKGNTSIDVVLNASDPKDGFESAFTVPAQGTRNHQVVAP